MTETLNVGEEDNNSPESLRRRSTISTVSSSNIPIEFLQIWNQLPNSFRLDSSLINFKKEYEKVQRSSTLIDILHQNHCQEETHCVEGEFDKAHESIFFSILRYIKLTVLVCCWVSFSMILMTSKEKKDNFHLISVPNNNLKSYLNSSIPTLVTYDSTSINVNKKLALGAFVLLGLYILIMFELVHRTIAALLAATSSIAILAALNEKPTVSQITSWVDFDTLMLLFSMMVLVAIVAETGAFDFFAAFAYKLSSGKVLPLVGMLCFFTAFVSAFLDNVTVIMLIVPVTIRLCEVIQLNPVPVITLMVMFSNVGGAMTPVGDPPNVIIASNKRVIAAGVGFSTFTLHMGIGVLLALIILYGHFRFIFRNIDKMHFQKPEDNQELRCEIAKWQRAENTLTKSSVNNIFARDALLTKVREVLRHLENKVTNEYDSAKNYETTVKELDEKYRIKDKWLLVKSGVVMVLVITLFFLHSSPNFHLSIGSTAFLCVLLLLILADNKSFDDLLVRVEWSTLLFFAALFVLMEALTELGLISWIGDKTESVIMSVSKESRLAVAILLLLWVSSLAGALIDNVPLTTMMIRIVTGIAENSKLQLPLQPLVWALAFGACMGGNGTLIGATTNVVCAGVAEQYGYRVTFVQFFKMGFPILLTSTLTISVYLMIAHVVFEWNY